ncbi:MAG: MBL fold metallo-hydrolase, partial [Clostridia bacterium]|nr:MBL fold metallo-hydrolase [Clostridia bacterium]
MKDTTISENIIYIGADDKDIDLFENQYIVPNGVAYNSYLIIDEKIAIMETIDKRKTKEWFENLEKALNGRTPDYLIVSHLEPDHAYNIGSVVEKYPNIKIVGNSKTFAILPQFFNIPDLEERKIEVKEGDTLELGKHKLHFVMAPMVHWPEVMMEYEENEKILFSADGFGKFGALDTDEDWDCEARRYYFNIVGKYGAQV